MVNTLSRNAAQSLVMHAADGAVDWLEKRAHLSPQRVALVDAVTRQEVTYAGWNRRANRVANALCGLGLQKGDRVAVLAMNCLEYLDLIFACQKTGLIVQSLNWRLTVSELGALIQDATPRVLVYSSDFAPAVEALRTRVAIDHWITLGEQASEHDRQWADWVARAAEGAPTPVPITMDDPWMLCYTGGTTGLPKGAILTHGTVTWNAVNTVMSWGLTADDVTFLNTPLFHTGGFNVFTAPLVHIGGRSIVCRGFDVDQVYDLIQHNGITIFFGVPTMFIMMQQHPRWEAADFSRCKLIISGGAPCPQPVFERFFAKGVAFKTGYGLTEAGPNNFWLPDEDVRRRVGAVGMPLFHVEVRIVNLEGQECEPGEVGELLIRGPHVIPGYWNNPQATAQTIIDGWLHTGDLAQRDDEGYIYIMGRSKDMIISGGENVYPAEVESVLLGHPAVAEAALIGVPDPKWNEVGRAIVVLRHGQRVQADELLRYVYERLAHYKVPKSIVFVDTLPKTGAGKLDKKVLQQQYGGEL